MKKRILIGFSLLAVLAAGLVVMPWLSTSAHAYDTWTSCVSCHGSFTASPYTSKGGDKSSWSTSLHDGHRNTMLNGDCNVCHSSGSRTPVYTYTSVGGTGFPPISCTGCHNGNGLRAHHVNSGAFNCSNGSCHSAGLAPAENVPPPYYFTPDTAHPNKPTNPCNDAVFGSLGLDKNGNLLYGSSDPACGPAPDTIPPNNVSITAPTSGQTVSGTVTVSASASDNVGVAGVQFKLDGANLGAEDTTSPYSVSWNTTTATNGSHTLTVVARDAAGNTTTSAAVTVTVSNTTPTPTPETPDMTVWVGKWIKLKIQNGGYYIEEENRLSSDRQTLSAYLTITAWDPENKILQATVLGKDKDEAEKWSETISLHYISGTNLNFLCWSQMTLADDANYGFTARVVGIMRGGNLVGGILTTVGGYHAATKEEGSKGKQPSAGWLKITGRVIGEEKVPADLKE